MNVENHGITISNSLSNSISNASSIKEAQVSQGHPAPGAPIHKRMEEVCEQTGVRPYVLRFWESEFPEISPIVGESGQKFYSHQDVEIIQWIKKLLFEDKLSIEKAKMKMVERMKEGKAFPFAPSESSFLSSAEVSAVETVKESQLQQKIEWQEKQLLHYSEKLALVRGKIADLMMSIEQCEKFFK